MLELLSYGFMQKALFAGILLTVITGFLSFVVVTRDLAFIGTGIAHIAFGGIALGIFLELNPYWVSLLFCLGAGAVIAYFSFRKNLNAGSLIGILLAFSMALGLILMKLKNDYAQDPSSYLFGSILSITVSDLWILGILAFILTGFFIFFKRSLLTLIFDPVYGQVMKMPMEKLYLILILLLAASVLSMVKIIGAILVEGLLILPGMAASLLAKNYRQQLGFSFVLAFLALFGGLALSASPWALPPGAAVILTAVFLWLLALGFRKIKQK